jgi:hypothetical protein
MTLYCGLSRLFDMHGVELKQRSRCYNDMGVCSIHAKTSVLVQGFI